MSKNWVLSAALIIAVMLKSPATFAGCECTFADFVEDDATWIVSTSYNILTGWTVNLRTDFYVDCYSTPEVSDCKAVWYGELWQGTNPWLTTFVNRTAQSTTPALTCNTLNSLSVDHTASNLSSDRYFDVFMYLKWQDDSFWEMSTFSFNTFSDPGDQ